MRRNHPWKSFVVGVAVLALVAACSSSGTSSSRSPAASASAAPTGDGDVLGAIDMSYVEEVTKHLTTIGSNPMGFRVFGTPQDKETAEYIAGEMRNVGVQDVNVEPLTGDGWLFKGGSVEMTAGGKTDTFEVSSLGGVPGTDAEGVSGQIVPVGYGTAPEYKGVDVKDKIAFAWWDYDNKGIWPNLLAEEAHVHGAKAIIIASGPDHYWYSSGGGTALGSNDGECSTTGCAPMVVISKVDAATLVSAMKKGTVQGKVTLDAQNLMDATGYQPIGVIPGTDPSHVVVITAHQDAWFTSAGDDSVAVGMVLALAKAVRESGYQPHYTWMIAPVTGEEYGLADSYADWLHGAFVRMTESHPEWSTDAVAVLNWEVHSAPYSLDVNLADEVRPFVQTSLDASVKDGLIKGYRLANIYAWNDGFVYTSMGAPSMTFAAIPPTYWGKYHTNFDNLKSLDFEALEPVFDSEARIALAIDQAVIPYSFSWRIKSLTASIDAAVAERYGADAKGLQAAIAAFTEASAQLEGADYSDCALEHSRTAVNIAEDKLTALSVAEGTIYPHEQAQLDVVSLDAAINLLKKGQWEPALEQLAKTSTNALIPIASKESYEIDLGYHQPDYAKAAWVSQSQFPALFDLYDLWQSIRSKGMKGQADFSSEIAKLKPMLTSQTDVYVQRVSEMTDTINQVTAELGAAASC